MGMLVKSAALAVTATAVVLSSGSAMAGKAATAAGAVSGTTIRARPAAPGSGNWLLGVSCPTPANCMAVGSTPSNEPPGVLAERWRGKSWKKMDRVPAPGRHGRARATWRGYRARR